MTLGEMCCLSTTSCGLPAARHLLTKELRQRPLGPMTPNPRLICRSSSLLRRPMDIYNRRGHRLISAINKPTLSSVGEDKAFECEREKAYLDKICNTIETNRKDQYG